MPRNSGQTINGVLRSLHPPKPNLTKAELQAFTQLKKDRTRIVLTVDNGVAMVAMDRKEYLDKATNLLSQPAYRTIERDPTNKLKSKLITMLQEVKKGNRI